MNPADRSTLRLHGHPVSNYHNIVHAALIEKDAAFTVVPTRASKDPQFLAASPMGKIPYLETPHGCIAETVAILEYLEDTLPVPALYPPEPLLRARARQIINIVQMYVEAPVRALFPGVFLGSRNEASAIAAARTTLDRATGALRLLLQPTQFLFGAAISHADIYAFYCLDIADRVTRYVYSRSLLREIGNLTAWSRAMADRPASRAVFAEFYPAFALYLEAHAASYDWRADVADVLVPPRAVGF